MIVVSTISVLSKVSGTKSAITKYTKHPKLFSVVMMPPATSTE